MNSRGRAGKCDKRERDMVNVVLVLHFYSRPKTSCLHPVGTLYTKRQIKHCVAHANALYIRGQSDIHAQSVNGFGVYSAGRRKSSRYPQRRTCLEQH
jgi:hypothetical protein